VLPAFQAEQAAREVLTHLDNLVLAAFTLEIVVKVVAEGLRPQR
jgi:hypothetical protein